MDYDELREKYERVYSGSGSMYKDECGTAESALALSFSAHRSLRRQEAGSKKEYLAAFFYRNCVYLSAAYHMARMGMLDPCGNNLRSVFETIIWQYAFLKDDGAFESFLQISRMEQEKFGRLGAGGWSNTRERALANLRRKHNFQKNMKKLYQKDFFESLFSNQYWVLSQKSHPGTFGINHNTPTMEGGTTMDKRPQEVLDNLKAILYLCSENIICFLNCFGEDLSPGEVRRMMREANSVNGRIPPAASLAPGGMPFSVRMKKV